MSRSGFKNRAWAKRHRALIQAGVERCRRCGVPNTEGNPLTFDHIRPWSVSRDSSIANITILCARCNHAKNDTVLPFRLPSLLDGVTL